MDCSLPGSSVHGIFQARILEWVAISFSRRSSQPGMEPRSPHCRQTLSIWSTRSLIKDLSYFLTLMFGGLSCCRSVAQSNLTLRPTDCSTLGFPVLHHLPERAQTQVHRISDAIQPSHPVVSSSSCPQSFPASGSFPVSQFFASGGQSIGASASASVLPMNIQDWFPLGWTAWISLLSKGLSRVFSNTTVQKHQYFSTQSLLYSPALTSIHDYWKNYSFDWSKDHFSCIPQI